MTFREFVAQRLAELHWTEGDLASAMGYGGTGYLYNVLNGTRPPPLKRMDDWVRALRLEGEDEVTLRLLAEGAHIPPLTKVRISRLERRIEALEAATAEKDAAISELKAQVAALVEGRQNGRTSR